MCEFVVNSFPFEIIMMGTAARRAGEPFVQQFLDKHSRAVLVSPSPLRLISSSGHANAVPLFPGGRRLCWRRPPRYTLSLRLATPTPSGFSRANTAFVCAALPATPYSSVGPRQHDRKFPDMLAYWDTRKLKKRDSPNNYPAHIHKATSIPNSTVPAPRVVLGYPKAGRLRPPALLGFRIRIRIP